jgi:hypothetical protein
VLLAEAIETFILYKRAENLSERTIVWYEHQLAIFAASQPATKTLSEVSATDIARYLAEQADPAQAAIVRGHRAGSLQNHSRIL